jgi:ketosteroid isomerase-like protein
MPAGYWRVMSQENVDFLSDLFAGAEALDKEALLAALPDLIEQTCDPEIEWVEDPQGADGRIYRGHQGVRDSWEQWLENFEVYGFEVERISDHGDRVLVVAVEHGRGSTSDAPVSSRIYTVYTFRAGKILRYQEFYDEQQALEALGRSD